MKETEIKSLLGPAGELSRRVSGYVQREQQVLMALDVWRAIETQSTLLAEAGTGTGKTYAYLVPAMLSNARTIISTGSKTLQDQLFYKDLPVVRDVTATGMKVALLKGRGNYVCPYRLDKHLKTLVPRAGSSLAGELNRVREWYSRSVTGDVTEVLDMEADTHLLPLITSNTDNCLGAECPNIAECPLYRARAHALEADILVINHHLLFADMAMQDDNLASLLPSAATVIVDEAHQVPDVAPEFFGLRVSSGQFIDLCRDCTTELAVLGNDDLRLSRRVTGLERAVVAMTAALGHAESNDPVVLLGSRESRQCIEKVDIALGDLLDSLDASAVRSRALANCHQRAARLLDRFAMLTEPGNLDEDSAHWLQVHDRGFVVHVTPLSIADRFSAHVKAAGQTWILTSATLTVNDSFDHIRGKLGLDDADERRYESPFNYRYQVKGWLPAALPRPGSDEHTRALVASCLPLIQNVRGRTFFLCTSYRALNLAAATLRDAGVICMTQGSMSRAALLECFRSTEACVLLATYSFWEGVDVRRANLQCLIIDKLPFANPDDPLVRARIKAFDSTGGNGFMDYLVPDAAITLRQGFGRLIRESADRGLFVLGDPRVLTQGYGRLFLKSLPDITWLDNQAQAISYIEELAVR